MRIKGRSTLAAQTCKLLGFGSAPHPLQDNAHVCIHVYKADDYVLCLSEGLGDVVRPTLGTMVPGSVIAPYAQRGIDGRMSYEEVKAVINDSAPLGMTFEW